MGTWRTFIAAALAVSGMMADQAVAQNLMVNGSFEAGLASWTPTGGCPGGAVAPPGNTAGAGGFPFQAPTDGALLLMSDALAPGVCTLFQDVVIPTATNTLTFAVGYNYANFGSAAAPGCSANVAVTTPGGQVLATAWVASGGVNQAIANQPGVTFSARAGSTVRVIITAISCADGPVGIAADNFVLAAAAQPISVPTLGEWAMILLALLLAGVGATALRARRTI